MHLEFALELSDIDLWNTDLLDTHLDLLSQDKYTGIPSILFVSIKSLRGLQYIFKTCLQDVFRVTIFRLQRRLARGLQDVLEDVKLLPWRPVEDVFKTCVFKTNKCLLGKGYLEDLFSKRLSVLLVFTYSRRCIR